MAEEISSAASAEKMSKILDCVDDMPCTIKQLSCATINQSAGVDINAEKTAAESLPGSHVTVAYCSAWQAAAQDDEPLRPEDAYRYVVSDAGGVLEVDWAIEDGYYL